MKKFLVFLLAVFAPYFFLYAEERPVRTKAIVFDFGGVMCEIDRQVLADHLQTMFNIDAATLAKIQADFRKSKNVGLHDREFWTNFEKAYQIELPPDWEEQFEEVSLRSLIEIEGMYDLVKKYKSAGYQVAMLSNVSASYAEFLRTHGYYEHFSPVVLSCEIGVDKPNAKAYRIMLEEVHVSPENCIFIDDRKGNVQAAIDLGIDGIHFQSYAQVKKELERRLPASF